MVLGHRTAHAAQHLARAPISEDACRALHVVDREQSVGARGGDHRQVHVQLARECTHRRGGLDAAGDRRGRRWSVAYDFLSHLDFADHGAGISGVAFAFERHERGAEVRNIADCVELAILPVRRGNIDDRLSFH